MATNDGSMGPEWVWGCRFCGDVVEVTPQNRNQIAKRGCLAQLFEELGPPSPAADLPKRASARPGAKKRSGRS